MQKVLTFILVGALAGGAAGLGAQTRSAADLFQEALAHEEIRGDLDKAIAIYQTILERFSADRPVAARALLHLARCYERLGRPEAAPTYDRLLRDYSDQSATASEARTRRAALGNGAVDAQETGLIERQQVWVGNEVNLDGGPSRDGRYLTFIDRSTGKSNVAVRDLRTGRNHRLTDAVPHVSGGAGSPVIAPDNSMVAYLWSTQDETSIRVIGMTGTGLRVLPLPMAEDAAGIAWSPDGKRLAAVVVNKDRTRQIALINLSDGTTTQLHSMGLRSPWLGGFSPDGRFLVFSARPETAAPEDTDADVFAIAIDGQRESVLVRGPARDTNPAWTPDGSAVVFRSDRSGADGLWAVHVRDGRPLGLPMEIRSNVGPAVNLGFSRDGTFFYGLEGIEEDVFIATVDPGTLNVTTPPRRLSDHFVGSNSAPQWSPDGRAVAFLRGPHRRAKTIVIRSMPEGIERTLPTKLVDAVFLMSYGMSWFPDGRSLLIRDTHPTQERRTVVRRVDVETGKDVVLFEAGEWDVWPPMTLSPDGGAVYYTAIARDTTRSVNHLRLMKRDLATGRETELFQRETGFVSFYGLMVSPDASRLVFLESIGTGPRTLVTLPVSGGQPAELYPTDAPGPRPTINPRGWMRSWTGDGRYVITRTDDNAVWAFPVGSGTPRRLDWPSPVVGELSPDGRQTVYPISKQTLELRTIQNLLTRIPSAP